ncbi:hypothetical protein EYF80_002898 [Liparis tanakae]|uniref:Uncharacterized protein n=1 Tax=Liparis tanakae TaxID=230148 RepID=A0A4Z2J8M0_9TELE|nr:hypothetical protein EYF80_002898 [Liparis tanakae]
MLVNFWPQFERRGVLHSAGGGRGRPPEGTASTRDPLASEEGGQALEDVVQTRFVVAKLTEKRARGSPAAVHLLFLLSIGDLFRCTREITEFRHAVL